MDIEVRVEHAVVVRLSGDVTAGKDLDSIQRTINSLIADGHRHFVIDLRNTGLIDSAGLGALVRLSVIVSKSAGHVRFEGAERVLQTFKIAGLGRVFESADRVTRWARRRNALAIAIALMIGLAVVMMWLAWYFTRS